jgi:hypothetical protein
MSETPQQRAGNFRLRPDRVAYFEARGWRAYYDRDWFKLLRLIVSLCQEQFRIPFPVSLLAAYYVTRASIAWAPIDHDVAAVNAYYEKFYRFAGRYSGLRFDPKQVAALETEYNDVHRRLSGKPDKSEFIQTMIKLHCAVFGITPEQARESAELRVLANDTVDLITSHTSLDVEGDWARLEEYLRQCYRSIAQASRARPQ